MMRRHLARAVLIGIGLTLTLGSGLPAAAAPAGLAHAGSRSRLQSVVQHVAAAVASLPAPWTRDGTYVPPDPANRGVYPWPTHTPGANCFPQSCPPNDPEYPSGSNPGDDYGSWWLHSYLPPSAPVSVDPEGASGMSVDRAWQKYGLGTQQTVIAYFEGGINYRLSPIFEFIDRVFINRGELPYPEFADGTTRLDRGLPDDPYDLNGDGIFNVNDYAQDPRLKRPYINMVGRTDPRTGLVLSGGLLTPEDLIAAFGDCQIRQGRIVRCVPGAHFDNDGNGYPNDISGWNFFRNNNDTQTENISYGHSDYEMRQMVATPNDGHARIGLCPDCMVMPVKTGDECIGRTDKTAEAVLYAADIGVDVIAQVVVNTNYSEAARAAYRYALKKGTALVLDSNDFDSMDHTDGMLIDGAIPGNALQPATTGSVTTAPANRFDERSNVTSYGAHNILSCPSDDGATSDSTPMCAAVIGLIRSYGRKAAAQGKLAFPLTPLEAKQVATMTALNINDPTLTHPGVPNATWNAQYGYGRPNLYQAAQTIFAGAVPPEVQIGSPGWFQYIDPVTNPLVDISGRAVSLRRPTAGWQLQWAIGLNPTEAQFKVISSGSGGVPSTRQLGVLDLSQLPAGYATQPLTTDKDFKSVEQYDVTIRLVAKDDQGNWGEDRRVFAARHDPDLVAGLPIHTRSSADGGVTLANIDGRAGQQIVFGDADGYVHVMRPDGTELPGWPQRTGLVWDLDPANPLNIRRGASYATDGIGPDAIHQPVLLPPAVGDIDGDGSKDIVVSTMDGGVYAWHSDGSQVRGWPKIPPPDFGLTSVPPQEFRGGTRAPDRGAYAAPVLADLEGTAHLDVIQGLHDGRVYAWRGDGTLVPGWPATLVPPAGARVDPKIIATPAVGDIDGDGKPEVVVGSQITSGNDAYAYAFHADGRPVAGWPVAVTSIVQAQYSESVDYVGEGVSAPALLPPDASGRRNVVLTGSSSPVYVYDGGGNKQSTMVPVANPGGITSGSTDAAYVTATGSPSLGDLSGTGRVNILVSQVGAASFAKALVAKSVEDKIRVYERAWDVGTGVELPVFPRLVEGFPFFATPSVADVGGDPGPEVIEGDDTYTVHAFNGLTGREPAGWPKFTGMWNSFSTSVGDLYGDGKLEVVTTTREGWLFAWRTDGAAAAPPQWPGFRANTCHTAAYLDGAACRAGLNHPYAPASAQGPQTVLPNTSGDGPILRLLVAMLPMAVLGGLGMRRRQRLHAPRKRPGVAR